MEDIVIVVIGLSTVAALLYSLAFITGMIWSPGPSRKPQARKRTRPQAKKIWQWSM